MKYFKLLISILFILLLIGIIYGAITFFFDDGVTVIPSENINSTEISQNIQAENTTNNTITAILTNEEENLPTTPLTTPSTTPPPTSTPPAPATSNEIHTDLNDYNLELPINGATGYTSISINLYNPDNRQAVISTLQPGVAFTIIKEEGAFWYINVNNTYGWIEHKYCMINLPDVIPSIIYDDTNSYKSIFKSAGKNLNGITDQMLYDATAYNNRFSERQYLMPVIYAMAKNICKAQSVALENGDCLKIYETYRPYDVQMKVSNSLTNLMNSDKDVYKLINTSPWDKSWFIATTLSNHQRGIAMDVSLVKVISSSNKMCGNYSYLKVDEYEEYQMPTTMHELSSLATTFTRGVSSKSKTEWRNVPLSSSMNEPAKKLQNYCTTNNLYPLASEWWHFNDLDAREAIGNKYSTGKYYITNCLSTIPE